MTFLRRLLLIGVLMLFMTACTAGETEAPAAIEPTATTPASSPTMETAVPPTNENENLLANTQWTLGSFGPVGAETPVLAGTAVTLTFEAGGQAGGSGGCNTFGANYQVQRNTLTFGEITSTLMACTEAGVTEQEQHYLEALRTAGEFEQTGDQLVIYYDDGQGALNFTATTANGDVVPSS